MGLQVSPTAPWQLLRYPCVRVTGPLAVSQTVCCVPVAAVFAARTATGPTFTPQMVAATVAATPILALLSTFTSPTETFTSPLWFELFWAAADAAIGPPIPTPRIAVANSVAPVFLIDSKSYLLFVSLGKRPIRCPCPWQ